ncbi:MAG: metallophosphoesterase [Actinobacteria bacterium]|nr:metallophosphoesterase [Actinomycetota bacterium]
MRNWKLLIALVITLLFFILFLNFENNSLTVTNLDVKLDDLPPKFDGYKILHISDLHGKSFGPRQRDLVAAISKTNPDLIAVTGDLIDHRRNNDEAGILLLRQITGIAPVYFVTGNHEQQSGRLNSLENRLTKYGVKVLRNSHASINRGNERLSIVGMDDVAKNAKPYDSDAIVVNELNQAMADLPKSDVTILLAHRPEKFSIYSLYGVDLILAGHAHGGQIGLPLIGGLYAPDQGFFPKYISGPYKKHNSTMVVSRGLGNSIAPQRIFNRPEIVLITLRR